jgi:uncharacterized membrane protein YcaP (DUF421 family)
VHLIAAAFDDIVQLQIPIWDKVLRTVAVYVLIYVLLRLAKRDAAQLTASDFVVVLLLSNVVQNAIIGPDDSFVGGAIGAVTLIVTNELVARWEWARKMGRADRNDEEQRQRKPDPEPTGMFSTLWATRTDPVLLIDGGEIQEWALRGLGISQLDLFAELRRQGVGNPSDDIQWAEIRTGGAIDYRLKPEAEPATKSNIDDLHRELRELRDAVGRIAQSI